MKHCESAIPAGDSVRISGSLAWRHGIQYAGRLEEAAMRTWGAILVLVATTVATSCNRDKHSNEPAARQLGRDAYKTSEQIKRGAKEAAQELRKAGKEIRKGWKEAQRDETHRKE